MSKHEFVGTIKRLRVFLGISESPEGFDAAVCSTDAVSTPGALSIIALRAAGLAPEAALRDFEPPVKLVREGKFPVLVVQTINRPGQPEESRQLLEKNLPAGLGQLASFVQEADTVWMPLLGTGGGTLGPETSVLLTLKALEQWSGPSLDVLLAAPDQPTVTAVRRALLGWKFSRSGLRIAGDSLELQPRDILQHSREALLCAEKMSEAHTGPISARDLLLGIATVAAAELPSKAFSKIDEILPLSKIKLVQRHAREVPGRQEPVEIKPLSPGLSRSLARGLRCSGGILYGAVLVTAALLSGEEQALNALCRSAGTSLSTVREKWFQFVIGSQLDPIALKDIQPQAHMAIDWKGWWRKSGVELPWEPFTQAGFIADTQASEDQLGIATEAEALARLALDMNVSLPLSIGLLGDWGSGKSFFLERMQQAVARLKIASEGLCRHVVQIRFNAWHFSDTNLWASMVAHIFDEVWSYLAPTRGAAEEREHLRREIEAAQGALHEAESQLNGARAALEALQQSYDKQLELLTLDRTVADKTRLMDDELLNQLLKAAESIGWGRHLKAINDVEESLKALNSSTSDMRLLLSAALRRGPLLWAMLIASGVVLVGTCLRAAGVWVDPEWLRTFLQSLGGLVIGVGTVASAIVVPLARAASLLKQFRSKLEEARDAYEKGLKELSGQDTEEFKRISQARRELESFREARDAAEKRLAELQQCQAGLEPNRLLRDFLSERAESQDYRSRQGIISLVRRDFEKLSELMRNARKEISSDKRSLERIILYVDDLDRCSPERVVEVLEAIHLLLATDLFVVVVAVDSRWLLRSLQVRYREMLDLDETQLADPYRVSTPQNYLEKIFQIPLALGPMPADGFDRYIDYLTESSVEAASTELARLQGEVDNGGGGSAEALTTQIPKREESTQTGSARVLPAEQQASQPTPVKPSQSEAPAQTGPIVRLVPRLLVIRPEEQRLLKALAPLLPTPRIVKRLVNVFRLIKAAVPTERLSAFEDPKQGRYRPVLLLLAILYGRPRHADVLLKKLHERALRQAMAGTEADPTLHDALAHTARLEGARDGIDWSALAQIVRTVAPEVRVSECEPEARLVARYSFVTGQHCHTWGEPVAATAESTEPTEPAPTNASTKQSAA
jgi:hypothetical protein